MINCGQVDMMPLTQMRKGSCVTVVAVDAGRNLQARLAALGLIPGVRLEVVNGTLGGPVLVELGGSRLMLGCGMARKIVVK